MVVFPGSHFIRNSRQVAKILTLVFKDFSPAILPLLKGCLIKSSRLGDGSSVPQERKGNDFSVLHDCCGDFSYIPSQKLSVRFRTPFA